jgi:hypothetical protein
MNGITKGLVRLYPRAWRERYGEEFVALLEERPASFADAFDILRGAFDAHVRRQVFDGGVMIVIELRKNVLAVLWAWAGFVVAGVGFQKMTEYEAFVRAAREDAWVGLAFYAVVAGALAALVAVLAGGAPIVFAAVRRALGEGRKDVPLLFAVPALALAGFVGYVFLLTRVVYPAFGPLAVHDALNVVLFLSLVGVFVLAAVASTAAVSMAVARSEIDGRLFRFALFPAVLAALAMGAALAATVTWGVALLAQEPRLFWDDGGLLDTNTAVTWLAIVAAMAVSTVVATVAVVRGFSARAAARTGS